MRKLARAVRAGAPALDLAVAQAPAQAPALAADRVPQLVARALRLRKRTASSARCKEWVRVCL
ncbi:hypothetical protein PR001_g33762 [Phytophthora rubi]|uniref:Uncharacterized protein n=1 Tax=Phytophthora rubi TaxID=129364 RepID=A0A6A3GBI1_9STRA|nr:hypothetical protein PR001_g33762 [Phytophthora rubi]